jgi:Skp family chaperone for outer membrane proteins
MRRTCSWVTTAAAVLSVFVWTHVAAAQNQSPPPAGQAARGPTIALLDVGYVFKNHNRFKGTREDLKADAERTQTELKAEANAVAQLGERLREFRSGTNEYKSLEAEMAKRQAELSARVQLWKRDMTRSEAKIINNVYKEICDVTDYYAQQHGIDIVLRFDGDPPDPEQLDSVWTHVNRPVVSYRSDMDITQAIMQEMNRGGPNRAPTGRQQQVPFRQ